MTREFLCDKIKNSEETRHIKVLVRNMKKIEEKKKIIEELKSLFEKAKGVIFLSLENIKNEIQYSLRNELKEKNNVMKVAKKTLIKIADSKIGEFIENINTPFAVIFNINENLEAFKIIKKYSEKHNLEVLSGFFEDSFLDKNKVLEIGSLPTKDILLQKMGGILKNLFNKLIFDLKFPLIKIKKVVSEINKNK